MALEKEGDRLPDDGFSQGSNGLLQLWKPKSNYKFKQKGNTDWLGCCVPSSLVDRPHLYFIGKAGLSGKSPSTRELRILIAEVGGSLVVVTNQLMGNIV